MGKNLTTNQKTELAKSAVKTRRLITIEFKSPLNPFMILENDSVASFDIKISDTVTHTYHTKLIQTSPVQASLDGNSEKMDVIISDISQDFAGLVADHGDVLTNTGCKIEQVIFDNADSMIGNPILLFEGLINNIQLSQTYCAFSVERPLYSYSTVSPNMTYDINCQFKFKDDKDVRCQYKGAETKCDKTLARCKALGNVTNFGGYPSVVVPVSLS